MALTACGAMPVITFAAELVGEPRVVMGVGLGASPLEGSLVLAYENIPRPNSQHAANAQPRERGDGARRQSAARNRHVEPHRAMIRSSRRTSAAGPPIYAQTRGRHPRSA
jgi:hypothetical protein